MAIDKKITPRGIRNNNPFNIRKGNTWQGERPVQTDMSFEEFKSMEYGIRAGLKLMRNQISGFNGSRPKCSNLYKLIHTWAPPTENDTFEYIKAVVDMTGINAFARLHPDDKQQMISIAMAITKVECGISIDRQKFESAWSLLHV